MQTLYQIALTIHIVGLSTVAGATLVDYIFGRKLWREYFDNQVKAVAINEARSGITVVFVVGFALLILSGVTMMGITTGAFASQIWFKIKFGVIVLIITNDVIVRKRYGSKLSRLLSEESTDASSKLALLEIRNAMTLFHFSQCIFVLIVFILSVFKFN
jgi:hypothetical protein